MKECDNSKIHISSNFILAISLLIMFGTLLLRPSLHCNTPLHFTTLHPTTHHYTSLHFTTLHSATLHYTSHFTQLHFTTLRYTSPHFTQLHFTTLRLLHFKVLDSWWWTERPSETCKVLLQNKINLKSCTSRLF